MECQTPAKLRELILTVVSDQSGRPNLQQGTVLSEVANRLGGNLPPDVEKEILTQWHDLVRTGYFAWGHNLLCPDAPFFHITDRGQATLGRLDRDPGNPSGYLGHLATFAEINEVAKSYLVEGLDCYVAGLYKAAAVMVGATAESLILELRDTLFNRLSDLGEQAPNGLSDWRVKTVSDTLHTYLDSKKAGFERNLREEFEVYWLPFADAIRVTRNEAGHPSSVDPISQESVHASFLLLPHLARLSSKLGAWVEVNL